MLNTIHTEKVLDENGNVTVEAHLHHYMSYDTENDNYLLQHQLTRTITDSVQRSNPDIKFMHLNTDGCKKEITSNNFWYPKGKWGKIVIEKLMQGTH